VLAGGVIIAGGERLRAQVQAELADLAVPRPRIVLTGVPDDQVLCGAIQSALGSTRDAVFDTAGATTARTTTN
jgi:hypothetical protein